MTKEMENDYLIKSVARFEDATARMLTKGRVGIEINKKGLKACGSDEDVKFFIENCNDTKKTIKLLKYFGHEIIEGEDGKYSGSGINVFTLVSLMQGDIEASELWNDLVVDFKQK